MRSRPVRGAAVAAVAAVVVLAGILVMRAVPATSGESLSTPTLDALVAGVLWPASPSAARAAQDSLTTDPVWQDVSRGRFDELEEILRRGRRPAHAAPGFWLGQIQVATEGGEIPVLVRLPSAYEPGKPSPLLLAMHGGPPRTDGQAQRGAERMMQVWAAAADRQGWIVAAPVMLSTRSVDAFTEDRLPYEVLHVEQAVAIVDALSRRFAVDHDHLVSTGISLGSNFSIAFAAARPDLFSAIVPVSTEGESRERLLRNLTGVPTYVLEGARDTNILTIDGPRALRNILFDLGGEIVYREFSTRAHEGFQEHYDDVLRWLVGRPRRQHPRNVLRVPHEGIMPLARRVHWVEIDSRQGLVRARIAGGNRIDVTAHHVRRVKLYLDDTLVDLDRPVAISVNGEDVFTGKIPRSLHTALEQVRATPHRQAPAAVIEVAVPASARSVAAGLQFAAEMKPTHEEGRLSYWETFAVAALDERFPGLGLDAHAVALPAGLVGGGASDRIALHIDAVSGDSPVASAGLQPGDLLLEFDGELFYEGDDVGGLHRWLRRELRGAPRDYPIRIWRDGGERTLVVPLGLGSYAHRSEPPPSSPAAMEFAYDHYHRVSEFEAFLEQLVLRYPLRARLSAFGRSREGRRLLAVEINNPTTGPAADKPAFYVDGNIHGGELLGGEGALYFLQHLLAAGEAGDPQAVTLLDRNAFYVVPLVNPDGRAISVDTPENHRWNVRPVDEDGDGRFDEDPADDLDGDGRILRMRVIDREGEWTVDPDDPRLMARATDKRRKKGRTSYRVYNEGVDDDGDGRFNEDGVGGVDLNRNFPANWHPAQFASGPYPLSEPESRALVDYITSHPNIAAIHTFHTSGGLLLRFPTLADQDWEFPAEDLEDYRAIAEAGVPLTGYDNFAYSKKKIVDLMSPGHGVFNDWGSKVFGVLAMTTEMWKHPLAEGEAALLAWNDEVLDGSGFVGWYPYKHPQLGDVELGGWDRFTVSNPPEDRIEAELERNHRWVMSFAERLPRVEISAATARRVQKRARVFRLDATIANVGWMPTATAHAEQVLGLAQPVQVSLVLYGAERLEGDENVSLGVLPGAREEGPVLQHLDWVVRANRDAAGAWAEIVVTSEKAGTVRRRLDLNRRGR